jgi:hypothetical protein
MSSHSLVDSCLIAEVTSVLVPHNNEKAYPTVQPFQPCIDALYKDHFQSYETCSDKEDLTEHP